MDGGVAVGMRMVWGVRTVLVAALLGVLVLGACGKKGAPAPAGPPEQITWPRTYPTH